MRKIYVTTTVGTKFNTFKNAVESLSLTENDELYVLGDIFSSDILSEIDMYISYFLEMKREKKSIFYLMGLNDFNVKNYILETNRECKQILKKDFERKHAQTSILEIEKIMNLSYISFFENILLYKIINIKDKAYYMSFGSPFLIQEEEVTHQKKQKMLVSESVNTEGIYYIRLKDGILDNAIIGKEKISIQQPYKEDRMAVIVVSAKDSVKTIRRNILLSKMNEEQRQEYRKNRAQEKIPNNVFKTEGFIGINTGGANTGQGNTLLIYELNEKKEFYFAL